MVDKVSTNKLVVFERDMRNPSRVRLTAKNMALLYGHRSMARAEMKYLSPYEFTMYWQARLLRYPQSIKEDESGACHAKLTAAGVKKLKAQADSELVPGIDYIVKEQGGVDWLPLENAPGTASLRHEWILERRRRPMTPHFKGCPLPKHQPGATERNAKITMAYFHPWTLREDCTANHKGSLCV